MSEYEWIVFRFSEDMPEAYRPPDLDGLWMHVSEAPVAPSIEAARALAEDTETEHLVGEAVAYPTDKTEVRVVNLKLIVPVTLESSDGVISIPWDGSHFERQVAQVWEIRPLWKIDERKGR